MNAGTSRSSAARASFLRPRFDATICRERFPQYAAAADCGKALLACPPERRVATQVVRMVALYFGIRDRCFMASSDGGVFRIPFISAAVVAVLQQVKKRSLPAPATTRGIEFLTMSNDKPAR
jgi:hypothetical protein